ncbi:MAG TPA: hypothetical protein VND91_04790, partial [Candidatus Saccharimonadia bacterium]|nr:hypothetical protein [Candidatus Saccharimonadia bacterium]
LALELEHEVLALADPGDVPDAYAHALAELARAPDYVGAHALHALAAQRLAESGHAAAAAPAAASAHSARARVLEATPAALRSSGEIRREPESPTEPEPKPVRAAASSEDSR